MPASRNNYGYLLLMCYLVIQFAGKPCYGQVLYPRMKPYNTGFLEVSNIHKLYYEEYGTKNGIPVVCLHGGPGSSMHERHRRYFDPKAYRIVVYNQRGADKSTPRSSLEENDTWHLVEDMEKLRKHFGIDKWIVFGGSWGVALGLAYAETHVDRVLALVLREICTCGKEELSWFFQEGASFIFPEYWEEYIAPIPAEEPRDLLSAYYKCFTGDNEEEKLRCARAWVRWEMVGTQLQINMGNLDRVDDDDSLMLSMALIEAHYYINEGFFNSSNDVIDNAKIIHKSGIPVTIIHGRYDVLCPAKIAWNLYKQLPDAEFYIVENAGHSDKEVGIADRLIETYDKYKKLLRK